MKVVIYDNKEKDSGKKWLNELEIQLDAANIEHKVVEDEDLIKEEKADALISLGGDGTILWLTEFASKNNIAIIGVNTGKLGFLTEFERNDIKQAVQLFKRGELKKDFRSNILVKFLGKEYYALNDIFIQRIFNKQHCNMIVDVSVEVDDNVVSSFNGDGVVISSPTGATAYSFSAGGPVLSPELNVFTITPIAAHSLNQRPVVYNGDRVCTVKVHKKSRVGVFIDGRFIGEMAEGDELVLQRSDYPTVFLRKKDFDFFKRLNNKLKSNSDEDRL